MQPLGDAETIAQAGRGVKGGGANGGWGGCKARGFLIHLGIMTRAQFEQLVRQALESIPESLLQHLDNVDIVVEDAPTREQLVGSGREEGNLLLGLYEGLPLTERYDYGMALPDKITLFQAPIESICDTDEEIEREVRVTVVHEIAHHFGIDDDMLHELGI